ncbi:pyridoxamine 5'-phosphate oxidase family protein [Tumebacillus sp. ITR2]|uniref:Pyridoxamine 5'-phosphate oxidase family protein n=1 Tax=Tumebacillus amylolyticus TaxID=2801339 RepID=A0ABS1JEP9_9BACL|nr:pyridoxamine 5'-phosphate oxidase family protein [Tumebacillus amylolyticus]MBL0388033.1 pyridoxamine 5'-phosphate oxidase family protein [Tumebacillus amylolyticus]
MADKVQDKLSEELVTHLQGGRMVTVASIDAENGSPNILCISWLSAIDSSTLRFAIDGRSKLLQNIEKDERVTVTVLGLGSAYAVVGTARKYTDRLENVALNMAGVEIQINSVIDIMFYGGKLTVEPAYDHTYDKALAEKYDQEVFAALRR